MKNVMRKYSRRSDLFLVLFFGFLFSASLSAQVKVDQNKDVIIGDVQVDNETVLTVANSMSINNTEGANVETVGLIDLMEIDGDVGVNATGFRFQHEGIKNLLILKGIRNSEVNEIISFSRGGNVGMGESNPAQKLHMDGNINVNNSTSIPFINIGKPGNIEEAGDLRFMENTTGAWEDSYGFRFHLNGVSNLLTLESSNGANNEGVLMSFTRGSRFVGIGTLTPSELLDVNGTARVDGDMKVNERILQGSGKVRIGENSGNGGYSVYIGENAGAESSVSGYYNVAIGRNSAKANVTSDYNVTIGNEAAGNSANGGFKIAIGTEAMENNIGSQNIALGRLAGQNFNGTKNFSVGYSAGRNIVGNENITLGSATGFNLNGDRNFGAVNGALYNATCSDAVAIGYEALRFSNTSATGQIGIGYNAGRNADGNNGIFIGTNTGVTSTGDNNIFLGAEAGNTSIFHSASNTLIIDSSPSPTSSPLIYGEFDNDILRVNGELEVTERLKIADVINLTPSNTEPSGTSADPLTIGDIYLDDGTNTTDGQASLRYWDGSDWIDL